MSARLSLVLALGCAALAARPSAPLATAQPPAPAVPPKEPDVRVHHDPGHHVGRVEYLCFRDKDAELVSVGSDRAVRVWNVDPKAKKPRPTKAFFFPDIPSAASWNPNQEGAYLACGFYRRDGARHPVVRVINLNRHRANGPVDPPAVEIESDLATVAGLHFDPRGEHLMITGASGELWHWQEVDWDKPKNTPKKVPVPPMKNYTPTAVAFQSTGLGLAVAGDWNGKDAPEKPAFVCVAAFDGRNPGDWSALPLPGARPFVYSLDWHADFGLAVGYYTREQGRFARARVAVYPARGAWIDEKPLDAILDIGFTSRVAWMPNGMLLATVAQDTYNPLPPEFLKVEKGRLVRVPRNDVFPGLDNEPVRKGNGAGLNVCAVGTGRDTLALAWAGYAQGTIELARIPRAGGAGKPELVSLDQRQRENWYTRLGWNAATGEIVLTTPTGRTLAVRDATLWTEAGLPLEKEEAAPSGHSTVLASHDPRPLICSAQLPGKRVIWCDPFDIHIKPIGVKVQPDSRLFPGARSLLTFERSRAVVALGGDGQLSFWEYQPDQKGAAVLKRKATAALKDGALAYSSPRGVFFGWDEKQRIPFKSVGPDQTLARTYPEPGADDLEPAHIVLGLDTDVILPEGMHTFQVRVPHAGTLNVQVEDIKGNARSVYNAQVKEGLETVPCCRITPADRVVSVTLETAGVRLTTPHSIQVESAGRVVLFDVTPQSKKRCTEVPEPQANTPRPYTPTADALAKVLETLGGKSVVRHTASTAGGEGTTAALVEKKITDLIRTEGIKSNDCFVLLLKGHGDTYPTVNPTRAIFQTDDFDEKVADAGRDTGLTRDKLAELLGRVSEKTKKVVVILDCCKAENFLDTLHARPISFYPCSLRGVDSEAVILPQALDRIRARIEKKEFPPGRSGLVMQVDLLQLIRQECHDAAVAYAQKQKCECPEWGYGAVKNRFVLANVTPRSPRRRGLRTPADAVR